MFLKEWIIIISEKGPKGGKYREDWGWHYGKYIYVGKRTRPRTLFIHNSIGKICSPSPCDHGRASELVPLSLFMNIFGIFFAGRSVVWVSEGVRWWVPLQGCVYCLPRLREDGTLRPRAAFQDYPERGKMCSGKHLCQLSLGRSFPARQNSQFISFDICI